MWREANQEDIDVYSIESGILEKIAMDQTIAELIDAGWTEQEIIEWFQNEAEQYLDDDEKKIFQEYIYDLVHDLFVYHTYETNLNKALKTTTPWASLAYSDMVKYGELKNISIQVSSLSTQDIIFLTKHPKSDFMKHIQENYPQERNILYNTPQEKRNDEAYTQAVYNINQSRKQYMWETLTDQARISTFNTIYHNKKSLVQQSDSNLFDSKTTYIQHTNKWLESSIHISWWSDIYTQQLLQQEDKISIPSLTWKDKTIDIPTVSTKTTRVSTRQALAGTAPIQKPKTETRHKETTQKYLYQECILTEVCNAIQLHDNTRSIDTIANIHRPILTIIDQALSNLQPNQLKSILKLVSSDARQHSMAASELPLTLTPHQAKISPVANNMARFWGKYIWKKKGNLETKETETKPESLNISYNDIHDKINQRNKAVTITNTMEENIDKQILRGYIDQDIALEKTKWSDIYAVKTA